MVPAIARYITRPPNAFITVYSIYCICYVPSFWINCHFFYYTGTQYLELILPGAGSNSWAMGIRVEWFSFFLAIFEIGHIAADIFLWVYFQKNSTNFASRMQSFNFQKITGTLIFVVAETLLTHQRKITTKKIKFVSYFFLFSQNGQKVFDLDIGK